jgi:hypothetical protein
MRLTCQGGIGGIAWLDLRSTQALPLEMPSLAAELQHAHIYPEEAL